MKQKSAQHCLKQKQSIVKLKIKNQMYFEIETLRMKEVVVVKHHSLYFDYNNTLVEILVEIVSVGH